MWDACSCRWGGFRDWQPCNADCNGWTYRLKEVFLVTDNPRCPFAFTTCAPAECGYQLGVCNTNKCQNGGVSNMTDCMCPGGYEGKCCEGGIF